MLFCYTSLSLTQRASPRCGNHLRIDQSSPRTNRLFWFSRNSYSILEYIRPPVSRIPVCISLQAPGQPKSHSTIFLQLYWYTVLLYLTGGIRADRAGACNQIQNSVIVALIENSPPSLPLQQCSLEQPGKGRGGRPPAHPSRIHVLEYCTVS